MLKHLGATRVVFALILIGSLLTAAAAPTAAEDATPTSAESHGVRFTDVSGEETPRTLGFLVPEGETGALVAGSIGQSQGGPDLVYFPPGEHLVWYASGILWVGNSESVAQEVDRERQRLATMGLVLRDVTNWPATLDGQTPQQQEPQVQRQFAQAHGNNWPFAWAAQHNEELVRSRVAAATRPAPTPAAQPPIPSFTERLPTGVGRELQSPISVVAIQGFRLTLPDGRKCEANPPHDRGCILRNPGVSVKVLDGVINPWSEETIGHREWKP